jgi:hypothetical protein
MSFVSIEMKIFIVEHFPQVGCSQFSLLCYGIKNNYPTMMTWAIGIERFALNNKETGPNGINVEKYLDVLNPKYDTKYPEWYLRINICEVAATHGHLCAHKMVL